MTKVSVDQIGSDFCHGFTIHRYKSTWVSVDQIGSDFCHGAAGEPLDDLLRVSVDQIGSDFCHICSCIAVGSANVCQLIRSVPTSATRWHSTACARVYWCQLIRSVPTSATLKGEGFFKNVSSVS